MNPPHQASPPEYDGPVATTFHQFGQLPVEIENMIWSIFLAEEEKHQPRCLLPLSSYNPPIFLEIYPDRLAQARLHYAEFRIKGIWKHDYSLFFRPHHNVLNFTEWQHLGHFRTAIIFAMQEPKIRKNLTKIMFTPSWVGTGTPTLEKVHSGAADFCNFLARIGELPSLEHIDIVVQGVSRNGLWYDGTGFSLLLMNVDGRQTGYHTGDMTYMVYRSILEDHFSSWGERVPTLNCVKVLLPSWRW